MPNSQVKNLLVAFITAITLLGCVKGTSYLEGPPPPPPAPPAKPIASFSYASNNPPFQTRVSFTNKSKYATTYLWDFGDGITDTATSPVHNYKSGGLRAVQLIVFGPGGVDTVKQNVTVPNPPTRCVFQSVLLESHSAGTTLDAGSYPDVYLVIVNSSGTKYYSRDSYFINTAPTIKRSWSFSPTISYTPLDQDIKITFWDYDDVASGDPDDLIEAFVFNPADYVSGANPYPSIITVQGKLISYSINLFWL
jgi:hypothetical protein